MNIGVLLSLLVFLFWGLWTVFADLSSGGYTTGQTYLTISAINLVGSIIYIQFFDAGEIIPKSFPNLHFLLLTGLFSTLGGITYYEAIKRSGEDTGVVVTIASLYFIFSAIVFWAVFGESLSLYEWIGIILAAVSVFFMTYSF